MVRSRSEIQHSYVLDIVEGVIPRLSLCSVKGVAVVADRTGLYISKGSRYKVSGKLLQRHLVHKDVGRFTIHVSAEMALWKDFASLSTK